MVYWVEGYVGKFENLCFFFKNYMVRREDGFMYIVLLFFYENYGLYIFFL